MEPSQQKAQKTITSATPRQRLTAGIVLLAIVAGFTACWVIARYKIPIYPFGCGFKQRFGLPCPTCGMTTSILAFAQGRIWDSFYTQPAAMLFCSLVIVAAFFAFIIAVFGVYFPRLFRRIVTLKVRYIIAAFVIILAAGWAFTLAKTLAGQGR
jgi:hypothetical protein